MAKSTKRNGSFRTGTQRSSLGHMQRLRARHLLLESLEERTVLASTISGFVYVDANADGAKGASESGVPGVLMTLSGTDANNNAITRTTLTSNTGAYSFGDLPDGTYGVFQSQASALVDGQDATATSGASAGNDQITGITLAGNQTSANNNFGERGLKPEYVTLAWFFASSTSPEAVFREVVAVGEERAGNAALAASIRAGGLTSPTNTAPVAVNNTYNATGGIALNVNAASGVLANDTDAEGNTLSAALVSNVTNGTLTLNANGSFVYTPNASFTGTDTFTYRANDGSLNSNVATVTITVAANQPPVAVNDAYSTNEDTPLTVPAATGVLLNDSDPNNNSLTAAIVANATNGTVTLNSDGSFTYTPNANFNGTDSFTYRANDGQANSGNATVTITVGAVNDAPVAVNDSYTTTPGTTLTVNVDDGVLDNDTDAENNSLTAAVVATTTNGTLTFNANGSFTYVPNAGFQGTDSFTYTATDGTGTSSAATVSIIVNAPPVAVNDSYTVSEEGTLTVAVANGVLNNDTDADDDDLTAEVATQPANGTLTLNDDGSFTYTPNANFSGSDTFTYRANDGMSDSAPATVTITVTAANDAPVAANDSFETPEDTPLVVAAPGVRTNDTDPDSGDTLTATVVTNPTNGTLELNADGSFTYTPNSNFSGSDTFTYKLNDGTADSNTATVTITVGAANDAPVATADSYSTEEDTPLVIAAPGVLANDTDAEGSALTAVLVAGPTSGTLNLEEDGSFTYTPNANFVGSDTFTYRANDGTAESAVATVTITVTADNDAPVADDDAFTTAEDTPLVVALPGVLGNDTDAEDDPLTATVVDLPTNGTLTLASDGSFTYTPNQNFVGSDTFTYRANDGDADSNLATVTITVTAVNDAPVAADDNYETAIDTQLVVAAPGLLTNDTDAEGSTLTATLVDGPASGTLDLEADGSFTYTPAAGFQGTVSFTYQVSDGVEDSNTATVTIVVNSAPVAAADSYSTDEETELVIGAPGVLGNDTDADADGLTAVLVDGPANGTLELEPDGSFTYTPDADFAGVDTFTYRANDGLSNSAVATVTITVDNVNDAPVAVDDTYSTDEDTELVIALPGVLSNDTDADEGDSLSAGVVDQPQNGSLTLNADGSFTYTPNAGFVGNDSFTYRANDGDADSNLATVAITVNAVNDAPVAVADEYTTAEDTPLAIALPGVLTNDTDAESQTLTAVLVDGPANGTLELQADGSFTYTPDANFTGEDTFTYRASDGTDQSQEVATVTITVTPANDAPVAEDDEFSTDEDTPLVAPAPGVLTNDTDVDAGETLTVSLVTGPNNGTLELQSDGSFTYTPGENFSGTDTFSYRVNDGEADSNTATVTITVDAVNDAPVATADSYETPIDTALVIPAPGVLTNDTDAEGTTLTSTVVTGPTSGSLELEADGSFTYTPNTGFQGTDTFTYVANDGTADSTPATVTIVVNSAPAAGDDAYTTDEDTPLTVAAPGVLTNDTDADGDSLTAVLVDGPTNGTLELETDGSFVYTPEANFTGTDSFTYRANDDKANSNLATVTITVSATADAPVAADDTYTAQQNTPLAVELPGVLANDTDADGDSLTAVLVDGPDNGTLDLQADGSFTYTPSTDFFGTDTFTYRANDGDTDSEMATVTITVNRAPAALDDTYTTEEDAPLTVAAPGVLANDTDTDGNPLTAVLVDSTDNGTLELASDGSFTYTPNANFSGSDTFTYRANDGSADSALATVTITISPVADAPVAADDAYTTAEDTLLEIAVPGVLGNDTDAESNSLTAVVVDQPDNGTLTLETDGSFTYLPDANFVGSDTFTYRANDGGADSDVATVTITVTAVNDAPVAVNDALSTAEDTALVILPTDLTGNDTDADGDTLEPILLTPPTNGLLTLNDDGTVTYTPNLNFVGTDSFTYRVNDGTADSNEATVTVTVTPVNDAPVAVDDSHATEEEAPLVVALPGVLANDTDADAGDVLTAILVDGPDNGTLAFEADGSFSYTPGANFVGEDTFTYRVNDGQTDSNVATVTISVTAVNDAPVAADDEFTTLEDTALVIELPGVLGNDTDVDSSTLTAAVVGEPSHGTLALANDGSFTYTPAANFFGSDTFTYRAGDGTAESNLATVTINVTPANDAPVAGDDSFETNQDAPLSIPAPGLLANDSDADNDPLTTEEVTGPTNGTLSIGTDGSFLYTPNPGYVGPDSFTYLVTDGAADSEPATVTISVDEAPQGESFGDLVDNIFSDEEDWLF